MYGYCDSGEASIPWIILKYEGKGSLEGLLNSKVELSIFQKLDMALDIARGMSWFVFFK